MCLFYFKKVFSHFNGLSSGLSKGFFWGSKHPAEDKVKEILFVTKWLPSSSPTVCSISEKSEIWWEKFLEHTFAYFSIHNAKVSIAFSKNYNTKVSIVSHLRKVIVQVLVVWTLICYYTIFLILEPCLTTRQDDIWSISRSIHCIFVSLCKIVIFYSDILTRKVALLWSDFSIS